MVRQDQYFVWTFLARNNENGNRVYTYVEMVTIDSFIIFFFLLFYLFSKKLYSYLNIIKSSSQFPTITELQRKSVCVFWTS